MKKISESYTINYILVTGTSRVDSGGSEHSTLGHNPEALHVSDEQEVVEWFNTFGRHSNVEFISVVKHTDEIFEKKDLERISGQTRRSA